jgi:hypothetical protein
MGDKTMVYMINARANLLINSGGCNNDNVVIFD